jgi:rhodanese-related sulfurtransferase
MLRHPFGPPNVPEIDPRDAWEWAERGEAVIIDVREDDEVTEIAVPGATHIPLATLREKPVSLPKDRQLLLLCRSGQRSSMATQYLRGEGFTGATNIKGGIIAWYHAGLPTNPNVPQG